MAIKGALHGIRARGGFNVEVKLSGDWVRLNDLINNLDKDLSLAASTAQRRFAEKYKKRVKVNIKNGGRSFGYRPLTKGYSIYKHRKDGPRRSLYWSGTMANSVDVVPLRKNRVGVGIPKNIHRPDYHGSDNNRLSVSEYANVLEHGAYSMGIVKRPVFKDTFKKDMGGKAGLKKYVQWQLVRNYAKKGIKLNKL